MNTQSTQNSKHPSSSCQLQGCAFLPTSLTSLAMHHASDALFCYCAGGDNPPPQVVYIPYLALIGEGKWKKSVSQ